MGKDPITNSDILNEKIFNICYCQMTISVLSMCTKISPIINRNYFPQE